MKVQAIKTCTKCGATRPQEDFYPCKTSRGGLRPQCKTCEQERSRLKYQKDRARVIARNAEWKRNNPEKVLASQRRRVRDPEQYRAYARRSDAKKAADPIYRLHHNMARRVRHHLAGSKGRISWRDLVGYDIPTLRAHLERQFLKGMSWANYGEWHIDHIVPISFFRVSGPADEGFRLAWALTNLRPVWAAENLSKRHKRVFLV